MRITHSICLAALLSGLSACASNSLPVASNTMPAGIPVSDPPPGFVSFCIRFADQCSPDPREAPVATLDGKSWALANQINLYWNEAIVPEHDKAHYGISEYWTIPNDGHGDCKDYALAKRKQLSEMGIPLKALRLAIVLTPTNEQHAVLTLATDKGDYVLDNLTNEILPWNATGYRWLARQRAQGDWNVFPVNDKPVQLASLITQ